MVCLLSQLWLLGNLKPIFPRLDSEAEIAYIKESMQPPATEEEKEEIPSKPQIDIKDFDKVEIKAATIIDAEHVKKSDKLLKIQVDLDSEQRTNCIRNCQILYTR
ncbi:hypothetical protein [Staphylococcus aureus]|uniref:hypothetical protein n=1 Tax=Staphylococcus aureus TaxID=1280 RepID=UPI00273D6CD7|nr:hypothetical protein [Staphylococcus aureus]